MSTRKLIDFRDEELIRELEREANERYLTFNAYIRLLVKERRR